MALATAREFRVGEVIGQGFQVLIRNFGAFAVISLLVTLPLFLFELTYMDEIAALETIPPDQAQNAVWGIMAYTYTALAIHLVCSGIASGALTYGTIQDLRGRRAGFGECLGRGLALILPVLGVSIAAGIGIIFGMFLLIVPGIILLTMWWIAVPATVIERPGVFASLKRSSALTKGSRWRVLGIFLIVTVVAMLVTIFIEYIVTANLGLAISTFIGWLVSALITSFSAVLAAVGYYQLRAAKEGAEIDDIARVFD